MRKRLPSTPGLVGFDGGLLGAITMARLLPNPPGTKKFIEASCAEYLGRDLTVTVSGITLCPDLCWDAQTGWYKYISQDVSGVYTVPFSGSFGESASWDTIESVGEAKYLRCAEDCAPCGPEERTVGLNISVACNKGLFAVFVYAPGFPGGGSALYSFTSVLLGSNELLKPFGSVFDNANGCGGRNGFPDTVLTLEQPFYSGTATLGFA